MPIIFKSMHVIFPRAYRMLWNRYSISIPPFKYTFIAVIFENVWLQFFFIFNVKWASTTTKTKNAKQKAMPMARKRRNASKREQKRPKYVWNMMKSAEHASVRSFRLSAFDNGWWQFKKESIMQIIADNIVFIISTRVSVLCGLFTRYYIHLM